MRVQHKRDRSRDRLRPQYNGSANHRNGLHGKGTSEQPSEAFVFECVLCGKVKGRANVSEQTGDWVISCWSCDPGSYLFELAETLGVRDAYALKENPRKYLAPYITRDASAPEEPDPLPSVDDIRAWRRMLREEPDAMRYLLIERGLTRPIIHKYALGYDGRAFTLPVLDVRTRKLVNVKRRHWRRMPVTAAGEPMKYTGLTGRGATIYPGLPATGPLVLCEGEFDALVLRRYRLPSITITTGMATRWRPEWGDVSGRLIAVLYDAGKRGEQQAANRVAELRRIGAGAWAVPLSKTGMKDSEDVTDWFVTYGRTRTHLVRFMNHEYRSSR